MAGERPRKAHSAARDGRGKDPDMYIQYRGFSLDATSRIYAYQVVDPPQGTREFTVDVQNDAFRSPPFRVQDGPGICFARVKQELDRETTASPAEPHLSITPSDIRDYVEKTYPKPVKKWSSGARP